MKKTMKILKMIIINFQKRVNLRLFHLLVGIPLWTSILKLSPTKFCKTIKDTNIGLIFRLRSKVPLLLFDKTKAL